MKRVSWLAWKTVKRRGGRFMRMIPWQSALLGQKKARAPLLPLAVGGGVVSAALGGLTLLSQLGKGAPRLLRSLEGGAARDFFFRGHRVVYYVAGQGPPLLLCHSVNAAASAYEMRAPFTLLQRDFQVFAIDLLGFGASDRPALDYDAELYIALLTAFLREVMPGPSHVCASSLSAAFAAVVAARHPDLVRSLLLVEPTGLLTLAAPQRLGGQVLEALFRAPLLGEAMFNVLVSRPSLRYYLAQAYGSADRVDPAQVAHSYATAHQPGARFAPAAFVGRALNVDLSQVLGALPERTLIVWTPRSGYMDTPAERAAFERQNPALRMVTIPRAGGLVYDEQPERFADLVRELAGSPPSEPMRPNGRSVGQGQGDLPM